MMNVKDLIVLMKTDKTLSFLKQYYLIRNFGEDGYETARISLKTNKGYYTLYKHGLTDWEPTKVFHLDNENDLEMFSEIVLDFFHNPDIRTGWNPNRISCHY